MARPELIRLLDACKQAPEDDAARLVLADWLEEYGDEDDRQRAAFVRLDVAPGEDHGRPNFLKWRMRMWKDNAKRWLPARRIVEEGSSTRGLVWAKADASGLCKSRPGEGWAWVEALATTPGKGQTAGLLAAPALAGIGWLSLPGRADVLRALADAEPPATLRGLSLAGRGMGADRFLASPLAARLRTLWVSEGRWHDTAWDAVGRLEGLESLMPPVPTRDDPFGGGRLRLRSLDINAAWPTPAFAAMTRSDACAGLRRLGITSGHRPIDVAALASARFWPTLEHLRLHDAPITDPAALARCHAAPSLRVLVLGWTGLDAGGLRLLAGSPLCAALDRLSIHGADLGPEGARAVMAMPAAPLTLDLGGAHLGDEGVTTLAAWPGLARCRVLNLSFNHITAAGVASLASSPHAAGLIGLSLYCNPIKDDGLRRLLRAPWAARLEELDINSCHLTERATGSLARADLPALKLLAFDHDPTRVVRERLHHVPCLAGYS